MSEYNQSMTLCKQSITKWGKTDKIIGKWIQDRHALMLLLYKLLNIHPFDDENIEADWTVLQKFCQNLIDYVSAGHFEVFEKIAEASEAINQSILSKELIVGILQTTVVAMDFNTKYEENKDLTNLKQDLSNICQSLITRMDLEDDLIKLYMKATSELNEQQQIRKTG